MSNKMRRRSSIIQSIIRNQQNHNNSRNTFVKTEIGNIRAADENDLIDSDDDEWNEVYPDNMFSSISKELASSILFGSSSSNTGTFIVNNNASFNSESSNTGTFIVNNNGSSNTGSSNSGTFIVNNSSLNNTGSSNMGTFIVNNSGTFIDNNSGTFIANNTGSGTFLANNSGTFVSTKENSSNANNKECHSGLTGWNMQFLNEQHSRQFQNAQKRKFNNFGDNDLIVMLKSVKNVAQTEINLGEDPDIITDNYEEVRSGIVQELIKRGKNIPLDYEKL